MHSIWTHFVGVDILQIICIFWFIFFSCCHFATTQLNACLIFHNTTTFERAIYNECYWFQNPRHVKEEHTCFKRRSEEEKKLPFKREQIFCFDGKRSPRSEATQSYTWTYADLITSNLNRKVNECGLNQLNEKLKWDKK